MSDAPEPLDAEQLAPMLARLDAGADFKAELEALLLAIPLERAELLMLLLREGRGAWQLLCEAGGGDALFVGNAFSGTVQALAACGFDVTVVDRSPMRLAFCAHRTAQWTDREARTVVAGSAGATSAGGDLECGAFAEAKGAFGDGVFEDDAFDLVVREDGAPSSGVDAALSLDECRRVARGEFVLVADNRLGYKRSRGWRGRFEVPSPLDWLRDAWRAPRGEKTLVGWRRALDAQDRDAAEAWSLYPTSLDFTYVAAIDRDAPRLYIGPKERKNAVKLAGARLGLFGTFSPSFALRSRRRDAPPAPRRLERVLDALAERVGEPRGRAEHLVATRGNSAVVLCRGADPTGEAGEWCLHVPLSRQQRVQIERHHDVLERLPTEHPGVPAPRALWRGEVEGLWVSVERRLPGLGAPQLAGEARPVARFLREAADRAARLVVAPAAPFGEEDFARLVASRFALVRRFVADARVERALDRMEAACRERLVGEAIPLVLHHADLRSKHLQVTEEGALLGVLDWGSSTDRDLPYFDLLHLVVHERKQAEDLTPAAAWRLLLDGGLRAAERAPLDDYADRLGLSEAVRRGLEEAYPVFVAAMAEANWDYSRPRWLERLLRVATS